MQSMIKTIHQIKLKIVTLGTAIGLVLVSSNSIMAFQDEGSQSNPCWEKKRRTMHDERHGNPRQTAITAPA